VPIDETILILLYLFKAVYVTVAVYYFHIKKPSLRTSSGYEKEGLRQLNQRQ
jgi:hypothetical protein